MIPSLTIFLTSDANRCGTGGLAIGLTSGLTECDRTRAVGPAIGSAGACGRKDGAELAGLRAAGLSARLAAMLPRLRQTERFDEPFRPASLQCARHTRVPRRGRARERAGGTHRVLGPKESKPGRDQAIPARIGPGARPSGGAVRLAAPGSVGVLRRPASPPPRVPPRPATLRPSGAARGSGERGGPGPALGGSGCRQRGMAVRPGRADSDRAGPVAPGPRP